MYNFSVFWSLLNITCKLLNYILKFFCYWHTQIKIGCDCASKSNQAESQVALWTLNEESGSPPTLAECTDWFSILDGTKWDFHVTSLRGILDYHLKSHGIITLLILKLNYPSHWSWCCRTLLVYRAEKGHTCVKLFTTIHWWSWSHVVGMEMDSRPFPPRSFTAVFSWRGTPYKENYKFQYQVFALVLLHFNFLF